MLRITFLAFLTMCQSRTKGQKRISKVDGKIVKALHILLDEHVTQYA